MILVGIELRRVMCSLPRSGGEQTAREEREVGGERGLYETWEVGWPWKRSEGRVSTRRGWVGKDLEGPSKRA